MGDGNPPRSRYEFRVWGQRLVAQERLSGLADSEQLQLIEDRYLLVGDATYNIKIRKNRLKVKRLLEVRSGFQRWTSASHPVASVAEAFESVSDRSASDQAAWEIDDEVMASVVGELQDAGHLRTVKVKKRRRRYRFGSVKAEVSVVEVDGDPRRLLTLAIEGKDLDDLVHLRSALGLADMPNMALHLAVDLARHSPGSHWLVAATAAN